MVPSEYSSAGGLLSGSSRSRQPLAPRGGQLGRAHFCLTPGSTPGRSLPQAPLTSEALLPTPLSRLPLQCVHTFIPNVISPPASWGTRRTRLLTGPLAWSSCPIFQIEETKRPSLGDLLEVTQPHCYVSLPGHVAHAAGLFFLKYHLCFVTLLFRNWPWSPMVLRLTSHFPGPQKSVGGQGQA